MAPASRQEPTVEDSLEKIASEVGSLLTLPDAADPQMQQIIQALQGAIVGMVHQLRAHKAQMAAQPQGQTMSADQGQPGYGNPPSAGMGGADMAMAGAPAGGAPGGGSPDEMARVLGPVGRGNIQ